MDPIQQILLSSLADNSDFKCAICNRYLSVGPILFISSVGSICGRCYDDGELIKIGISTKLHEQKLYENLAKYIKFPCSYQKNGCTKVLKWGQVHVHEKECPFRQFKCLLQRNDDEIVISSNTAIEGRKVICSEDQIHCDWVGRIKELAIHIQEDHLNYYDCSLGTKIDTTIHFSKHISFSSVFNNFTVLVIFYKETLNLYFCKVMMDLSYIQCHKFMYDVEIVGENKKNCIVLPGNRIQPFADTGLSDLANSDLIFETCVEMDLQSLSKFLKSEILFLSFKIQKFEEEKQCMPSNESSSMSQDNCTDHQEILNKLQCHCKGYLFSPIYQCCNYHNSCSTCYMKKGVRCEKCGNKLYYRNYALERLSLLVKYPCTNRGDGCQFNLKYDQFSEHSKNCEFSLRNCILGCSIMSSKVDMLQHIQNNHELIEMNKIFTLKENILSAGIIFDQKIFSFVMNSNSNEYLSVNVKSLGKSEVEYEYKLAFINSFGNSQLSFSTLCEPFVFDRSTEENEIRIPLTLLRQISVDYPYLRFKINIRKIFTKPQ